MRTQDLVLESDSGARGVSLRRLVQAGVASRYDNAQTTISTFGYAVESGTTDGLPDLILTNPADVVAYLNGKRSSARKVISHAILACMDEIVALMNGRAGLTADVNASAADEVGAALAQVQDPELRAAISGARDAILASDEHYDHSCAFVVDRKGRQRRNADGTPQREGEDRCIPCQRSAALRQDAVPAPHSGSQHQRQVIAEVKQIAETAEQRIARLKIEVARLDARDRDEFNERDAQEDEQMSNRGSAYTTQIDWRAFVVQDEGGARGVSLRALVDAGLYSRLDHASQALEDSGLAFSRIYRDRTGGRPGVDCLFHTLTDAQMFCVRARTPVGEQIARLIIEHHGEFQRLLNGDAEAQAQLAAVQPVPQIDAIESHIAALDPMLAAIYVMRREAAALAKVQEAQALALANTDQRLARIDTYMQDRLHETHAGWWPADDAARRLGLYTANGQTLNSRAVRQVMLASGLEDEIKQLPRLRNGKLVEEYVISPRALELMEEIVPATFVAGANTLERDEHYSTRWAVIYRPKN